MLSDIKSTIMENHKIVMKYLKKIEKTDINIEQYKVREFLCRGCE